MGRYVRIVDRPPVRFDPVDVRCPRCWSPPGSSCRRVRWFPERLYVVDGRVRRLPAGPYVVDEPVRAHASRRELARAETARMLHARRH